MEISDKSFWLVWTPNGLNPTYQHTNLESATKEAERLAKSYPSTKYFVLQATHIRVCDMLRVNCIPPSPEEPPF